MPRLVNGDCREFMKTMPDHCVDLILTDPPYNIAKYSTGNIPYYTGMMVKKMIENKLYHLFYKLYKKIVIC